MADTRKAAQSITANAFETTLSTAMGASDLTINVASTSGLNVPCYIVIEPDSASNREYVFIDSAVGATSFTTTTADNRYLTGSAASSGLTHAVNSKVRVAPMKQHFEDIWSAVSKVVDGSYASGQAGEVVFDIAAGAVDVANDLIAFIDNDDNSIVKKESVVDLVAGIAGTGLTASSGQLALPQAIATSDDVTFNQVTGNLVGNVTGDVTGDQIVEITVKVADDGSGSQNVFYFLTGSDTGSGVKSLDFDFKPNTKYKFDTSDSSLSTHNFKFSTVQDGSNNGGSEYTTNVTASGTPGSANAYTEIEVTAEVIAANKLYYYCSVHSGMGGDGQITLTDNKLQNFTEVHQDTITSSSGVVTLDLSLGNSGSITLSEDVTQFTINNVPKDGVSTFTLIVTQDSTDRTVALLCAVNGAGGANAKTPGAAGWTMSTGSGAIDIITFVFKDGGTPYLLVQQAFA